MDLSAHALAAFGDAAGLAFTVIERIDDLDVAWMSGRLPILAPRRFLDEDDRRSDPLPHNWRVTSDTIAARVADRLGAIELVLLKSATLPAGTDRAAAARLGLVDPEFPRAAAPILYVSYVNLRDPATVPVALAPG